MLWYSEPPSSSRQLGWDAGDKAEVPVIGTSLSEWVTAGYFYCPWREKAAWWHSAVHLMEVPGYPKSASLSALVCKNVWKISWCRGIDSHIVDLCDQEGRIWLPVSLLCYSKFGEASLGPFLQLIHLWVCYKTLHAYRLKLVISFQS